jgi:hypothetical protein
MQISFFIDELGFQSLVHVVAGILVKMQAISNEILCFGRNLRFGWKNHRFRIENHLIRQYLGLGHLVSERLLVIDQFIQDDSH